MAASHRPLLVAFLLACADGVAAEFPATELVLPGLVSTPATEVKLTISPDGQRMLWGTAGWGDGQTGWDIYESVRQGGQWSAPAPVAFNSAANDFDPFFTHDGSAVYFFSNRSGGEGGDDLYRVAFDAARGYGDAANLGPVINTPGDEWAPVVSFDGTRLLFSSDGHGGEGGHDLFIAGRKADGWGAPQPLGAPVNGPAQDFDGAFVGDDATIVFASGELETEPYARLHVTRREGGGWSRPQALGPAVNCDGGLTIGPSVSVADPAGLYLATGCRGGPGRMDVYRIPVETALAPPP